MHSSTGHRKASENGGQCLGQGILILAQVSQAQDVEHSRAGHLEGRAAEREPKNSSQVVLKLACLACIHRIVTTVVWTRRNFIQQNGAVFQEKEFHAKDARTFKCGNCTFRNSTRTLWQLRLVRAKRGVHTVAYAVFVHCFHRWVRYDRTIYTAHNHDSNLPLERCPLLSIERTRTISQCLNRCIDLVLRLQSKVAPAIIRLCPRLEHERQAQPFGHVLYSRFHVTTRFNVNRIDNGDAMLLKVHLLGIFVLDQAHRRRSWVHGLH